MYLVSVIIPVYNAAIYVSAAVESAALLPEVGEVILIEDGSKDSSLNICMDLVKKYDKVKLLTHQDNQNLGASESRNLGIIHAKYNLISFLDADDVYSENRFKKAIKLITSEEKIDGVYCAVGYLNEPGGKIFTLTKKIHPNKLFHYLIRGTYGHFHTNGILVKKEIFKKAGYFNPALVLHQDSELWLRLAFCGNLVGGELSQPVAMIRRHAGNRIWIGQSADSKLKSYYATLHWLQNKKAGRINIFLLLRKISKIESQKNKKFYWNTWMINILRYLFKQIL